MIPIFWHHHRINIRLYYCTDLAVLETSRFVFNRQTSTMHDLWGQHVEILWLDMKTSTSFLALDPCRSSCETPIWVSIGPFCHRTPFYRSVLEIMKVPGLIWVTWLLLSGQCVSLVKKRRKNPKHITSTHIIFPHSLNCHGKCGECSSWSLYAPSEHPFTGRCSILFWRCIELMDPPLTDNRRRGEAAA